MRLLYLTAGAAEMYCGTCLRDNALAAALLRRGHDVMLAPIYTPTTTDEANVSQSKVLLGGVSVFLQQHVPLLRHTPAFLDWVWDSTPVLKLASKRQIKVDPKVLGEMTVSMLKGLDGFQSKEIRKMLRWLEHLPRFEAMNLPFTLLISLAKPLRDTLRAPVACTMAGEEIFLENLQEPWKSQSLELIRKRVGDVDVYIAVSEYCARFMATYLGIPSSRIRTVPIGITLDDHHPSPARTGPPYTIGFFARIAPEKGLHVLAEAYRRLVQRPGVPPTRLLAAGYLLDEHREYLKTIERRMAEWGLGERFQYGGAPDRAGKLALLREMDVMSVPVTYDEPKGLTLLEAMASGRPIVVPDRGSFREIVTRTGGGVLVPPDDPDALADALLALLLDRPRAAALGRAGIEGVRRFHSVDVMATDAEGVFRELVKRETGQPGTDQPGN
jgi:glycosyltransferase involved in cell wall biosynthesis